MRRAIPTRRLTATVLTIVTILSLRLIGGGATVAAPAGPVLIAADASAESPGVIEVMGHAFTAGGRVYIGLFDRSGNMPDEVRQVEGQTVGYGRNGNLDPAAEPGDAGAFGAATGRWVTASDTIYGANGSLDPAIGFVVGGAINGEFLLLCGETTAIRAIDQTTAVWTNWLDVRAGC